MDWGGELNLKVAGVRTWNPPDTSDGSFQSDPELAGTATTKKKKPVAYLMSKKALF